MSLKTSESIKNLAKALHAAQLEMGAAKKDSANPFFKSKYADLGAVMEVTKEPLNKNGIVIVQPATNHDGRNFITTRLIHIDSGEWIESDTEIVCSKANDPQAKLAAETYTRRGSLQAMLFIPAEDDDGNTAAGRSVATASAAKTVTKANVTTYTAPVTASAPVTTATTTAVAAAEIPTAVKSSFRKTKTVAAAVAASASNASQPASATADDWS